jgi:hypothetical protein
MRTLFEVLIVPKNNDPAPVAACQTQSLGPPIFRRQRAQIKNPYGSVSDNKFLL